ncbi:MAG: SDR family NAD(P)-dependent oxidoreductase [Halioglobus sp.]
MLNDKTWWITGASSGIGAALAQALASAGARLILSGRNVDALEGVAKDCGDDVLILPFEATDFERIPALVDEAWEWAEQKGGGIDGLVNNAGISQRSLATDTVFEVYQKLIDIDLLAPIALTQALLPRMVAAGGGNVVAISSVAGLVGVPLRSAYCAAKHGLVGYHDVLRAETSHQGMNVLVVAPGSVRTNVSRNSLDAKATARGKSDAVIDAGMDPAIAAARILDAISTGARELVLAEGMEADIVQLRRSDPNALFDAMANMIAAGYAEKLDAT